MQKYFIKSDTSLLVRRFGVMIATAAGDKPVLDIACGSGRNAIFLSRFGCRLICMDRDLTLVNKQVKFHGDLSSRMKLQEIDFVRDPWPFEPCSVGGIVDVHFLLPALFPLFMNSLSPGGYLLIETVPACGGNFLQLPKAGELKCAFGKGFDFEFYRERKVGPRGHDAVTVHLVAKRRPQLTPQRGC